MSKYTITISGFETGLTSTAVRDMFQSDFPTDDVSVEQTSSTTYTITVSGFETGLTAYAVQQTYSEHYPNCSVSVSE